MVLLTAVLLLPFATSFFAPANIPLRIALRPLRATSTEKEAELAEVRNYFNSEGFNVSTIRGVSCYIGT